MYNKLIMAMIISALTGAVLGYHGVLWYGDDVSQDRENERTPVKKGRNNNSHGASASSNKPEHKLSLNEILKESNVYRARCALNTYCASIRSEQREAELQKILALNETQKNHVLETFFNSWAKQEPRRALAVGAQLSETFDRRMVPYYVFNAWAEKNPEEAAAYFLENADQWDGNGLKTNASSNIMAHLAKISSEKALEWISHFKDTKEQDYLKRDLINQLAQKDPLALLKDCTQLFPGAENKTYVAIAREWSKRDPVAAKQWIETLPEEEKKKSYQAVVRDLSEERPEEAMAWIQKNLDPKELSSFDNYSLMFALHGNAPSQAREWIESFPDSPEKSTIMQNFASWWPDRNYTEQAEYIFTIPDKTIRNTAMSYAFVKWLHDDEVAAKKWMDKAPLDKEAKEDILPKRY